jgi:hypothetical protein
MSHHPTDDVTAEDVEDDVEVEVSVLERTRQFRDVPRPQLIGASGQQLWLLVDPTFSRFLNRGNNIFDRPNQGSAKCAFVNRST